MSQQPPTKLPLHDIQGAVLDTYFDKHVGYFLLLRIKDAARTRKWLLDNHSRITSAQQAMQSQQASERNPNEVFLNIAFSYNGLKVLGVEPGLIDAFPPAFVEDSDTPFRARILGDVDTSASKHWNWGSQSNGTHVHLIVLAYFNNENWREEVDPSPEGFIELAQREYGMELVAFLDTSLLAGNKEHFGFRDLIGQPLVGEVGGKYGGNTIAPGEFVLGYENGFGKGRTSLVPSYLPPGDASEPLELGRNGSYLVFRQLEQDILGFWQYCCDRAKGGEHQEIPYGPVALASKMVGRWPSGHPLAKYWDEHAEHNGDPTLTPDPEPRGPLDRMVQAYRALLGEFHNELDDFDYIKDAKGEGCPFGSHIRRSNPRSWELATTTEESLRLSNLHRILRRGRTYGPPMMDPNMDTYRFPEVTRELSNIAHSAVEQVRDKIVAKLGHDDVEKHLLREVDKTAAAEALQQQLGLDDHERLVFRIFFVKRGVHFLCFNSDIERQFEFVQQQWCNNSKFAGLDSDADPLCGQHDGPGKSGMNPPTFTMPAPPLRHRCTGMKRFSTVKGSGYFLMPSISDVLRLARGEFGG